MGVLGLLVALGWQHQARSLDTVLLHPLAPGPHGVLVAPGALTLVLASIAGAYACLGSSVAINFSEEVDDPSRVVGRVKLLGGGLSVLLVILPMIAIAIGAPDLARTLAAEAPIAEALRAMIGSSLARVLSVVVALAIFDHVASALIAYSRLIFAAARSTSRRVRWLEPLTSVRTRSGAPAMAVVALGLVAILLTLVGTAASCCWCRASSSRRR